MRSLLYHPLPNQKLVSKYCSSLKELKIGEHGVPFSSSMDSLLALTSTFLTVRLFERVLFVYLPRESSAAPAASPRHFALTLHR